MRTTDRLVPRLRLPKLSSASMQHDQSPAELDSERSCDRSVASLHQRRQSLGLVATNLPEQAASASEAKSAREGACRPARFQFVTLATTTFTKLLAPVGAGCQITIDRCRECHVGVLSEI